MKFADALAMIDLMEQAHVVGVVKLKLPRHAYEGLLSDVLRTRDVQPRLMNVSLIDPSFPALTFNSSTISLIVSADV